MIQKGQIRIYNSSSSSLLNSFKAHSDRITRIKQSPFNTNTNRNYFATWYGDTPPPPRGAGGGRGGGGASILWFGGVVVGFIIFFLGLFFLLFLFKKKKKKNIYNEN